MARIWITLAALLGASGVALGAFHAHGLQGHLKKSGFDSEEVAKKMDNCETAVRYQMYHALAILGLGVVSMSRRSVFLLLSGIGFLMGVIGFCGGLYLIVFANNMIHFAIIPSGGLFLIIGWLLLAVGNLKARVIEIDSNQK